MLSRPSTIYGVRWIFSVPNLFLRQRNVVLSIQYRGVYRLYIDNDSELPCVFRAFLGSARTGCTVVILFRPVWLDRSTAGGVADLYRGYRTCSASFGLPFSSRPASFVSMCLLVRRVGCQTLHVRHVEGSASALQMSQYNPNSALRRARPVRGSLPSPLNILYGVRSIHTLCPDTLRRPTASYVSLVQSRGR